MTAPKSTWVSGKSGACCRSAVGEHAFLCQTLQADQHRVTGEGGEELVGRIAIAGGAEREHLPEGLFRFCQPIGKAEGFRAQGRRCRTCRGAKWGAAGCRSSVEVHHFNDSG